MQICTENKHFSPLESILTSTWDPPGVSPRGCQEDARMVNGYDFTVL